MSIIAEVRQIRSLKNENYSQTHYPLLYLDLEQILEGQ